MGVDTRKPPLPAPTESSTLQTSGEEINGTDLATNISRRTDRTSYSIPEDGSPVTISTSKRKDHRHKENEHKLSRGSHQSQTSLLIEYFEGGKGPNVHSRPSVRVKVTPSSARKSKDAKDHIQITEGGGSRKPSYTRRISLGPKGNTERVIESDEKSISSYTSAAEDSSLTGRRPPVEIEVMHKDMGSDLSGASVPRELNYMTHNTSDISSMPPDSMLDGNMVSSIPHRNRSRSLSRDDITTKANNLKAPSRRRSRSLSRERIAAQKVIEKLGNKPRQVSGGRHKHELKSRSPSVSKEQVEMVKSPKRRSSRHHQVEEIPSGTESSLLTTSQVSDKRKSVDQYSFRSGTSKSSLHNPKLLETVEDAIRRLILPELTALKHDNELTRKLSKRSSTPDVTGKPKVVLNGDDETPGTVLSGNSIKGRREHRRDRDYDSPSERSFHRGMSEETVIRDEEKLPRKRSKDGYRLRDAAAGAFAGGILTHAALRHHDSKSSLDRRERRRKHSKSHSRSASITESTEEIFNKHDVPPMPMRSDINESELTRDSILSERTSTPTSERRRTEIREVARGSPREVLSPASVTPTRSPGAPQRGYGTYHSNLSKGDISTHSTHHERSRREDDYSSHHGGAALLGAAAGAGVFVAEHSRKNGDLEEEHTYTNHTHGRGLSPIQSVASYQEDSEPPNRDSFRQVRSVESFSSAGHHRDNDGASMRSTSSAASASFVRSKRHQGINLEDEKEILDQHNLRASDLRHDGEFEKDPAVEAWYEQQHEQNDRYRDSTGDESLRDSTIDIKHMTNCTDDSMDAPYLDKVTAAQKIRGIGANAEYVHTPIAVESAVASLLDQSTLSGRSKLGERSYLDSPDEIREEVEFREASPRDGSTEKRGSPLKHSFKAESRDIDSISDMSRGLRSNADLREVENTTYTSTEHEHIPMGASGLPIADDPLPEIGHIQESESDVTTNPSIIQGPISGVPHDNREHWTYQPTPPHSKGELFQRSNNTSAHESLKAVAATMLSAAAGAGAGAALAQREREKQQSYEQTYGRNREDRHDAFEHEQDYERDINHDFGPIHDPYMHGQPIPTPPGAKDEGYISAANPRSPGALTPDYRSKGLGQYDDIGIGGGFNNILTGEDPFIGQSHTRHLSGNSHGMASPLYDSATGRGMDRIQSKDIVALMHHVSKLEKSIRFC